jgi:hypothetical protein
VNPAVAGTGLKIKTVESIAFFRPIVTWPNGVDGIGRPLLALCHVAENWYEFAEKTIALLRDGREMTRSVPDQEEIARELRAEVVYGQLSTWLTDRHGANH